MTDAAANSTVSQEPGPILTNPITIIAAFVMPKIYIAFQAFTASPPRYDIGGAIAVELLVLLGLSPSIIKGNRITSWIMAIAMWLQGLLSCVIPFSPRSIGWGLKTLSLVLGLYYIAGGLILVRRSRGRPPNQAL